MDLRFTGLLGSGCCDLSGSDNKIGAQGTPKVNLIIVFGVWLRSGKTTRSQKASPLDSRPRAAYF